MQEVKKVYQNVEITPVDLLNGKVSVKNKNLFINLKQYDPSWVLECDGKIVQSGDIAPLDIAPLASREITIPMGIIIPAPGSEYFLKISFKLRNDELWAKRGHAVASEQLKVPVNVPAVAAVNTDMMNPLSLSEVEDLVTISGQSFKATFSKTAGTIIELEYFGTRIFGSEYTVMRRRGFGRRPAGGQAAQAPPPPQVIFTKIGGPVVNLYRAPVDNDGRTRWRTSVNTQLWNLSAEVTGFNVQQLNDKTVEIKIDAKSTEPGGYSIATNSVYTVYGNGTVDVNTTFLPDSTNRSLPKLGFLFTLNKGLENVEYFGAGPFENYVDRKRASDIGRYVTTVDDMFVPYVRTQDCGNRTDVRWLTVTNHSGNGILVTAPNLMNFSTLHYTPVDLNEAGHPFELTRRDETILTVDLAGCGLGNGSCGPPPMDRYLLKTVKAIFNYTIKPYTASLGDKAVAAK